MPLSSDGRDSGWLSRWAYQVNSLSADSVGREAMADGYLTEAKLDLPTSNALNAARVGKWRYSFATHGGAVSAITLTGSALPANAIVLGGLIEVLTLVQGGVGTTGALHIEGADDLVAATVVAGAPWSSTGRKAIIPVWSAASAVKTSVARTPVFTIAANPVTAGIFNVFLFYVVSD